MWPRLRQANPLGHRRLLHRPKIARQPQPLSMMIPVCCFVVLCVFWRGLILFTLIFLWDICCFARCCVVLLLCDSYCLTPALPFLASPFRTPVCSPHRPILSPQRQLALQVCQRALLFFILLLLYAGLKLLLDYDDPSLPLILSSFAKMPPQVTPWK